MSDIINPCACNECEFCSHWRSPAFRYAYQNNLTSIKPRHKSGIKQVVKKKRIGLESFTKVNCAHLGLPIKHSTCKSKQIYACDLHGSCTTGEMRPGIKACQFCNDYVERNAEDRFDAGIVIGSYNMPSAIELQVKSIRNSAPVEIPILIVDDCSDGYQPTPSPDSTFGRLTRIVEENNNVELWVNAVRIGHCGGDLSAFYTGLQWAKRNKLKYLCKLSQRFIVTNKEWLQSVCKELSESPYGTLSRKCYQGRQFFHIRSEFVLMDVERWYRKDVLNHFLPRNIHVSTETVVWDSIKDRIDPPGAICETKLFGEQRASKYDGTLWHCCNTIQEYKNYASKLGVTLHADFTCAAWCRRPGFKFG